MDKKIKVIIGDGAHVVNVKALCAAMEGLERRSTTCETEIFVLSTSLALASSRTNTLGFGGQKTTRPERSGWTKKKRPFEGKSKR